MRPDGTGTVSADRAGARHPRSIVDARCPAAEVARVVDHRPDTKPGDTVVHRIPWFTVRDEVATVLSAVPAGHLSAAAALFADRRRRWFFSGQGRSGLVAQMAAMRLMHVGFDAHVVGEATAPAVRAGDGLVMVSGSGETPIGLHLAGRALEFGVRLLVVTGRPDSTLAGLAEAVIDVPAVETGQFGGTLFEQSALLLLDALALDITGGDPDAYASMQRRHTNLQ